MPKYLVKLDYINQGDPYLQKKLFVLVGGDHKPNKGGFLLWLYYHVIETGRRLFKRTWGRS